MIIAPVLGLSTGSYCLMALDVSTRRCAHPGELFGFCPVLDDVGTARLGRGRKWFALDYSPLGPFATLGPNNLILR